MAIPACIPLPPIPKASEIILPGGVSLSSLHSDLNKIPSLCSTQLSLFAQAGPALAPLKPLFDILDTVIALFNCFKAVPDALSQLNPKPIFDCIPELAKKIDGLLKLIPQLSIPLTIISFIDAMLAFLNCMVIFIGNLVAQFNLAVARAEKAAQLGDAELSAIVECSKDDIGTMQENANAAFEGIGSLIGVINILLGLIGGPEIPIGIEVEGEGLEAVLAALEAIAKVLNGIRDAIPIP